MPFICYYNLMKSKLFLLILTAAFLFSTGCSRKAVGGGLYSGDSGRWAGNGYIDSASYAYDGESRAQFEAASPAMSRTSAMAAPREADDAGAPMGNYTDAERKLVKRASISIRVGDMAAADYAVAAMLKKFDAYAASSSIDENSHYYSIRVPAIYYDFFLSETGSLGRLISRNEDTEDVTLRYYDLEGRLATKKELLKTYQSYLGKAKTIEEILSVESRISELQYDIDGTGKQLRNLADKVDYATINLHLQGPVTAAALRGLTFNERVKRLFGGFGGFLAAVAMALLGIIVYGIPILLILGLLFLLFFGKIGLAKKLWKFIKSN